MNPHLKPITKTLIMSSLLFILFFGFVRKTGINAPRDDGSQQESRYMIVMHLRVAQRHLKDKGTLPKSEEELRSLHLSTFNMDALVGRDSWGHPLSFHFENTKFSETITICSYGRDNFWGGRGDNKDICLCIPEVYCKPQ